jgi:hypothetical protein
MDYRAALRSIHVFVRQAILDWYKFLFDMRVDNERMVWYNEDNDICGMIHGVWRARCR